VRLCERPRARQLFSTAPQRNLGAITIPQPKLTFRPLQGRWSRANKSISIGPEHHGGLERLRAERRGGRSIAPAGAARTAWQGRPPEQIGNARFRGGRKERIPDVANVSANRVDPGGRASSGAEPAGHLSGKPDRADRATKQPVTAAGKIAPPSGNLSDRLSQQKGTIAPSNVDPHMMVKPPRNNSSMPVIPPPGSSGGNGSVVPK
jgi:hypothetical protein